MNKIKHPRKVLKIAKVNICSLRNKVHEVNNLLVTDDIHILIISETHLDNTFDDTVGAIHGYNIYKNDSNSSGSSVRSILRTTFLRGSHVKHC
jgi:exonuclease III